MIFKKGKLRNAKLRTKLMITYIILTVIPVAFLGYISYAQYTKSIEKQVGEYIPKLLDQATQNIDNQLNDVKQLPDFLYNSPQIIEILRKDSFQSKSNLLKDKFLIESFLSRSYINGGNSSVLGIFIHSKNRLYSSTKVSYSGLGLDSSSLPYGQNLDLKGQTKILLPYQTDLKFKGNPPFILFMRQLRDYENRENLGTVLIAIDLSVFEHTLRNLEQEKDAKIWITDQRGRIVYHTNPAFIGSLDEKVKDYPQINGSFRTTNLDDNYLISTETFQSTSFRIFHSIALNDLTKETNAVRNGTLIAFIIVVVISIGISIFLAWNVSHPLKKLTNLMNKVEKGDFDVDLPVNSMDEVGTLSKSFNSMIQEIDQLIKKNYQIELRQKDAELYALQSQINPHFMYNTLETIGYAIEDEEKDTVIKMVTILGRMLRYSLNNKDRLVPIASEVKHAKDYLTVQKFRFEDRINFSIDEAIDSDAFYSPKFIIQPVIENSIKYGLEEQVYCTITINIYKADDDQLFIKIKDNGPGIEASVLKTLKESLNNDAMAGRDSGFGLINVHARIAMIFGELYGITIGSEVDKGTEVIIKLPVVRGHEVSKISGGEESA
ncbi:cache domain-containing sensor histidine kinase [Aquibacillus salsiterrae]|uniref:histidine kinase n=1 Tax=Aquibacillus salsiterrae TaxID=2950439 RepID=A0A9X4AGI4_9BACI|nr:sensor histidine kinase [Aquibacillus salsiterrae]MDC3418719.1 sensor histidine kinase [Aquibacillus salsiterrae]